MVKGIRKAPIEGSQCLKLKESKEEKIRSMIKDQQFRILEAEKKSRTLVNSLVNISALRILFEKTWA